MKKLNPFTSVLSILASCSKEHKNNPLSSELRSLASNTLNELLKHPDVYEEVTSELIRGDEKSRPFTESGEVTPLGMKIGLLSLDVLAEKQQQKTNYAEFLLSQSPQGLNEIALRALQLVASRDAQPFIVEGNTVHSKNVQWVLSNVLNSKGWKVSKDSSVPMTKLGRAYNDINKADLMNSIQVVLNQNTEAKTATKANRTKEKLAPFSEVQA